jgi:hypothetical protein
VVVDELHYRGPAGDSENVPEYELRQTTSIELDASRYTFFTADNYPAPNAVHVVLTPGERFYRASWQRDRAGAELSPATMIPLKNAPPFAGFSSGDFVVFAIGHDDFGVAGAESLALRVNWTGRGRVR